MKLKHLNAVCDAFRRYKAGEYRDMSYEQFHNEMGLDIETPRGKGLIHHMADIVYHACECLGDLHVYIYEKNGGPDSICFSVNVNNQEVISL